MPCSVIMMTTLKMNVTIITPYETKKKSHKNLHNSIKAAYINFYAFTFFIVWYSFNRIAINNLGKKIVYEVY